MPDAGRKVPSVAYAEDYDDHEEQIKPQSRVHALVDRSLAAKSTAKSVKNRGTAPASDSGYSSVYSGPSKAPDESPGALTVRPSDRTMGESTQPDKVKDNASTRGTVGRSSRSRSQVKECDDPDCAECASQSNTDRRFVLPHHQPRPAAQSLGQYNAPYPPLPDPFGAYSQQQALATQARRLSASGRTRPVSFHGYGSLPGYVPPPAHGPPPSPSAYRNIPSYGALAPLPVPPPNYPMTTYGTTPPQVMHNMISGPLTAPPLVGTAPSEYSARRVSKNYQGYDVKPKPSLSRAPSQKAKARRSPGRTSRQRYSDPERSDYSDGYDSESSYSSQEHQLEKIARDRMRMPPPERPRARPPIQDRYTEPLTVRSNIAGVPRRSREIDVNTRPQTDYAEPPRSVRSKEGHRYRDLREPEIDYASAGEYLEIDRAERLPQGKSNIARPRYRLSRESDFDYLSAGEYIENERIARTRIPVDAPLTSHGRQQASNSSLPIREPQYRGRNQLDSVGRAEAYQQQVRGPQPEEVTIDHIRQEAKLAPRQSANSRISRRSSINSNRSKSDGVRIQNGPTTVEVFGGMTIQMTSGEEGASTSVFIDSSNNRETSHGSVYSSGSRNGYRRSRDMNPVHEEGGYERAL